MVGLQRWLDSSEAKREGSEGRRLEGVEEEDDDKKFLERGKSVSTKRERKEVKTNEVLGSALII